MEFLIPVRKFLRYSRPDNLQERTLEVIADFKTNSHPLELDGVNCYITLDLTRVRANARTLCRLGVIVREMLRHGVIDIRCVDRRHLKRPERSRITLKFINLLESL